MAVLNAGRTAARRPIMQSPRRSFHSLLVKPVELNDALQASSPPPSAIVPLCASWFLPNDAQARKGIDVFHKARIPGARFFDLDEICDKSSPYPHMLPDRSTFEAAMRGLGINKSDRIVVYDTAELGLFSAPRVAWTLKVLGHEPGLVHVLDNFRLWVAGNFPLETGEPVRVRKSDYTCRGLDETKVVTYDQLRRVVETKQTDDNVQIVDARPHGRWAGTDPEPRPGLSNGHIPGSISIPFSELLDPDTKTFLPAADLRDLFDAKGLDPTRQVISSCGSGTTAAMIEIALAHAGFGDQGSRLLYDGSWTEWAQRVKADEGMINKTGT